MTLQEEPGRKRRIREPVLEGADPILTAISGGVPLHTLKVIFRLNTDAARERLKSLKPLRVGRGGGKLYDFAQAAAYLVPPTTDLETYLKTLKTTDMPQKLQASWWEAKLKRQKWEKNAGELWPSGRVLEKLASVFKLFRDTTQLWLDDLEQYVTTAQREMVAKRVDALLTDMYRELVEDARKTETPSQLADEDEES